MARHRITDPDVAYAIGVGIGILHAFDAYNPSEARLPSGEWTGGSSGGGGSSSHGEFKIGPKQHDDDRTDEQRNYDIDQESSPEDKYIASLPRHKQEAAFNALVEKHQRQEQHARETLGQPTPSRKYSGGYSDPRTGPTDMTQGPSKYRDKHPLDGPLGKDPYLERDAVGRPTYKNPISAVKGTAHELKESWNSVRKKI